MCSASRRLRAAILARWVRAPNAGIQTFLENFGSPFGPPDIRESARFVRMRKDSLGWRHFEYQQTYALQDVNGNDSGSAPPGTQRRRLEVDKIKDVNQGKRIEATKVYRYYVEEPKTRQRR
jgi:hypothetical protein